MLDYADPHFECIEFEAACIDADCPVLRDEDGNYIPRHSTGNADIDAGVIYDDAT